MDSRSVLSGEVLEAYARCLATPQHEREHGLVEGLETFFDFVESVPSRYEHRFHFQTEPEQLGSTRGEALWNVVVDGVS